MVYIFFSPFFYYFFQLRFSFHKNRIDKVFSFRMILFVLCIIRCISSAIFFSSVFSFPFTFFLHIHFIFFFSFYVCWFRCDVFIWFDSVLKFPFVAQWKAFVDRTSSIQGSFFSALSLSLFNRLKSRKSLNNALYHNHTHIRIKYEKKSESS